MIDYGDHHLKQVADDGWCRYQEAVSIVVKERAQYRCKKKVSKYSVELKSGFVWFFCFFGLVLLVC